MIIEMQRRVKERNVIIENHDLNETRDKEINVTMSEAQSEKHYHGVWQAEEEEREKYLHTECLFIGVDTGTRFELFT